MPIAKGVFSCKAEATCDRNVSWNLGKAAALGALVLQRKGQHTSSKCIRSNKPGQMPAGLRLSAHKDLLCSEQVSKWRTAKDLGKGDGVRWPAPIAQTACAPWWTSLQGYDLNTEPRSFTALPWVKQLSQPRLESKYFAGHVSSEEHSCLLYHQDMPLLRGKEELCHDQAIYLMHPVPNPSRLALP